MTSAMPAPQTEFTPYLLQQAGLRASLLQLSFGFAADDWDDLRQDLALDCLRRLPRFDESRGNWEGFVRGVVRNHACVLASQLASRPTFLPISAADGADTAEERWGIDPHDLQAEDFRPALELSLDIWRAIASLPEELQALAHLLSRLSMDAVRRKTGLTASQLDRKVRRIRAAFMAAGIAPAAGQLSGGGR